MKSKYSSDLLKLIEEFQINNVKFIVCGGIACVLHGVERATVDIDLSVEMKTKNLKKIIEISKRTGLKPRIPEPVENLLDEKIRKKWINEKGALTYTFISEKTPLQVDIFFDYPKSYEELLIDCDIFDIEGIKLQ
jgi:hypothetical protein